MVRRELAEKVFRKEALNCGFTEGAYLCFEEDCDEPVALRELMDKGMYQAPVNERFAPARMRLLSMTACKPFTPHIGRRGKKRWRRKRSFPKGKTGVRRDEGRTAHYLDRLRPGL